MSGQLDEFAESGHLTLYAAAQALAVRVNSQNVGIHVVEPRASWVKSLAPPATTSRGRSLLGNLRHMHAKTPNPMHVKKILIHKWTASRMLLTSHPSHARSLPKTQVPTVFVENHHPADFVFIPAGRATGRHEPNMCELALANRPILKKGGDLLHVAFRTRSDRFPRQESVVFHTKSICQYQSRIP